MKERYSLSLLGNPGFGKEAVPQVPLGVYPALREAGAALGLSGPALRKKFERGDLPRKFLLRVGPRTLRVDLTGLVGHLKAQSAPLSA